MQTAEKTRKKKKASDVGYNTEVELNDRGMFAAKACSVAMWTTIDIFISVNISWIFRLKQLIMYNSGTRQKQWRYARRCPLTSSVGAFVCKNYRLIIKIKTWPTLKDVQNKMAFTNLFTKLSAVDEDTRSPAETCFPDR